ncbi:KIFC3 isoform 1, partial [Pan troglodytes]
MAQMEFLFRKNTLTAAWKPRHQETLRLEVGVPEQCKAAWCPEEAAEPQAMVPSRRTWNLGATPSLRGLWRVGRAPEPEPGMARPAPAPASPAARPFPHTGPGRLRTGRGKDTPVCGDEDSSARSAARPALAQCRALSVDWAGPGSPHGLYLTLQV